MNQFASGNCRAFVLFRQKIRPRSLVLDPFQAEWSLTWKPGASLNSGILSIQGPRSWGEEATAVNFPSAPMKGERGL